MNKTNLQQKKEFIQWFLDTCLLKDKNSRNILDLIANTNYLLHRVRIVENIRFMPNALLISAKGAKTVSYLYRLNNENYEDAELVVNKLYANPPQELHLWLSFDRERMNNLAGKILEGKSENAFEKDLIKELETYEKRAAEQREKQDLQKEWLLKLIDEALTKGDREGFQKLSERYKRISNA